MFFVFVLTAVQLRAVFGFSGLGLKGVRSRLAQPV